MIKFIIKTQKIHNIRDAVTFFPLIFLKTCSIIALLFLERAKGESMKKRIFTFILVFAICALSIVPAVAVGDTSLTIYINGKKFETTAPVQLINDTTYVPLRDFGKALANVDGVWDDATQTAYFSTSKISVSATVGDRFIISNGRYFYVPDGVIIVDGIMKLPIRELTKAMGAVLEWNSEKKEIYVYSGSGTLESADTYYDAESVYWLSRIIFAESGGEPLKGQIGVGNVVINRAKSGYYPNTIYGVIFEGYQFSPTVNGSIYRTPSEMSIIAAKLSLEGYNVAGDSLFFCNPNREESKWFETSLKLNTVIGNHAFYSKF